MGQGLIFVFTERLDDEALPFRGRKWTATCNDFPASIGRQGWCNVKLLDCKYLTGLHAKISNEGGKLLLFDCDSRHGTYLVDGTRLQQQEPVDLDQHNGEFMLARRLHVRVERAEVEDPRDEVGGEQHSLITGLSLENLQTRKIQEAERAAKGTDADAFLEELREGYSTSRLAVEGLIDRLSRQCAQVPTTQATSLIVGAAHRYPELLQEPKFRVLADEYGVWLGIEDREGAAALQAMRRLARAFLGVELNATADITAFAERVRVALQTFLLALIPLKDGLRRFGEAVGGVRWDAFHDPSGLAACADPRDAASALLGAHAHPRVDKSLYRILDAVMSHQLGYVSSVIKGVRVVLNEISPEHIEWLVKRGKQRAPRRWFSWGPWRFRTLWSELMVRFHDFDDESVLYAILHGREFRETYQLHVGGQGSSTYDEWVEPAPVQNGNGQAARMSLDPPTKPSRKG